MSQDPSLNLGEFALHERIGLGGMGEVWRAIHRSTGTQAAVKVITAGEGDVRVFNDSLRREIQAVAGLDHPSVIQLYDLGSVSEEAATHGTLVAGSPWLAMEYASEGALDPNSIRRWSVLRRLLLEILDALAHAHARGIVHRDMKPENVLVQREDGHQRTLLTDFGIAYATDHTLNTDTTRIAQRIAGTPLYMSPEQLLGRWRDYGPWTDLYALGAMAWELVTGATPFNASSIVALAGHHLHKLPPEFEPRFAVPDALETWLRRLLEKRIIDRYQRAADASETLAEMAGITEEIGPTSGVSLGVGPGRAAHTMVTPANTWQHLGAGHTPTEVAHTEAAPNLNMQTASALLENGAPARSTRADVPRLPGHWLPPPTQSRLLSASAGLSLFGLRDVPFVGRNEARDVLWAALGRVHESGQTEVVQVRGGAGVGKSRLVEWVARRADEVGGALVFKATHNPSPTPTDGLGPMVSHHFSCGRMEPEGLRERWTTILNRVGEPNAEALAELLTQVVQPVTNRMKAQSRKSHHAGLRSLLKHLTRQRPILMWLDDAQWGADALAFVSESLTAHADIPMLIVLTVRDDTLPDQPVEAAVLNLIAARPETQTVALEPLSADETRNLIDEMLTLDQPTVDAVVSRAEGVPLFAVQLLDDWVQRGGLEVEGEGLRVRQSTSTTTIPGNIETLWIQRISDLVAACPVGDAGGALQMAAALGLTNSHLEWTTACRIAGIGVPPMLMPEMERRRLASSDRIGWSFAHGMLRDFLVQDARTAGSWAQLNQCIDDMLTRIYPSDMWGLAERRATHLQEAGNLSASLPMWVKAIDDSLARAAYSEAYGLAARLSDVVAGLGLPEENLFSYEARVRLVKVDYVSGRLDRAIESIEEIVKVSRRMGWSELLPEALLWHARLYENSARPEEAAEIYPEALAAFRAVDNTIGIHRSLVSIGWLAGLQGDFSRTLKILDQAAAYKVDDSDIMSAASVRARALKGMGRPHEAREALAGIVEMYEARGYHHALAAAFNDLGELDREIEAYADAERNYLQARALYTHAGSREQYTVALNLGMLAVDRERFEEATAALTDVMPHFERIGMRYHLAIADVALARCAAALNDTEAFDARLGSGVRRLRDIGFTEPDIARLMEISGEDLRRHGATARALASLECARDQWAKMDRTSAVERVDAAIRELEEGQG